MLNDILWPDHMQWQSPTNQTLYRTRPFTEFWVVSIEHLRRVWHADRGRLLLRIRGPVPLGITWSLFENDTTWRFWKGNWIHTSTYVPAQSTKDQLLVHHINTLTKINVKIDKCELPTFYWLPKLHKRPYKSRFISNSSHCSTTILSKHITSALTAVKDHVMKYSETAFSNSNVNYFWSIKNSSEVIEKLRLRNFQGSQVSSFDFSSLYTSLPHDLIKAKVLSLVNWCFNRESESYLCTSLKAGFF